MSVRCRCLCCAEAFSLNSVSAGRGDPCRSIVRAGKSAFRAASLTKDLKGSTIKAHDRIPGAPRAAASARWSRLRPAGIGVIIHVYKRRIGIYDSFAGSFTDRGNYIGTLKKTFDHRAVILHGRTAGTGTDERSHRRDVYERHCLDPHCADGVF